MAVCVLTYSLERLARGALRRRAFDRPSYNLAVLNGVSALLVYGLFRHAAGLLDFLVDAISSGSFPCCARCNELTAPCAPLEFVRGLVRRLACL